VGITTDTGDTRKGESLFGPNDMDDACRKSQPNYTTDVLSLGPPCRLSVRLKYVNPNSLTFSSSAKHWARESGSEINDEMEVKFLREFVLGITQN